ncbi:MAG: hypothetical protein AAF316_00255 [Cyanobacteria bacterium P01_A01_bin.80]
MEVLDALFKILVNEQSGSNITYFFAGILFSVFYLERRFKLFDRLDSFNDNFNKLIELIEILKNINERNAYREYRDKDRRGRFDNGN